MAVPDVPIDVPALIAPLAAGARRIAVIATGGGSAGIAALASTPGASAVIVEGLVPSAREAIDGLLGGPQESYCSSRTARRLAMTAWERCRRFGAMPEAALGIACTASLATTVPKRGTHRVIVALQSLEETSVTTLELAKGARSREAEESIAATLLLDGLTRHVLPGHASGVAPLLREGEGLVEQRQVAAPGWSCLLSGSAHPTAVALRSAAPRATATSAPRAGRLVFPGSFDPLHDGHRAMARVAERIAGLPVEFELSIRNVEKPSLDYLEIAARAGQFDGETLWLTSAPTFVEKLSRFPGARFVVGADTFLRLGSPRFYGGSPERAAEAVAQIARTSAGLIVFGRVRDGVFTDPSRLEAPEPLRAISRFVSEEEFRDDVSSSALRRADAERSG